MLSDEQKRVALKKNMEAMSKEAKKLRAGGVEGITLTYYADEESFQKMRLDVALLFQQIDIALKNQWFRQNRNFPSVSLTY